MSRQQRFLVIRQDRVGDVVLATPVLRALRRNFPDAFIAALVRPAVRAVLEHNPNLDLILTDDHEGADAGWPGFRRMLTTLRHLHFTTCLMLLPSERYTWMTFIAPIRRRIGVGGRLYHYLTCTRRVSRNKYIPLRHEADYCLDQVRALGVDADDLRPEIVVTEQERHSAVEILRRAGWDGRAPLVFIHPQSGGSAPNWVMADYVSLARALAQRRPDAAIVVPFMQAGGDVHAAFIDAGIPGVLLPPEAQDLRTMITCMAHADVVFSGNTGPMHLATALGRPTVSMFCPLPAASAGLWGPNGNDATIMLPPEKYCATRCPGDPHICTLEGGILVKDAVDRIVAVLEGVRRFRS